MQTQEIHVTIDPQGNVKIDVQGAPGDACLALTRELERLLGGELRERNFTAEFDQVVRREERRQSQEGGR